MFKGQTKTAAESDNSLSTGESAHEDNNSPFHEMHWDALAGAPDKNAGIDSWVTERAGWTRFLEKAALAIERPANRLIGTAQLNPFYHTGTIATLLLIIVGLTGFFLFLFYQYGFDASYNAVLTRIEQPFIARTIRAIHRYASGALVITTLLHAFRTLFMERFHGPRWLAWVTGVFITILLWFAGITGYWLVWDERAQVINDGFVNFISTYTPFGVPLLKYLQTAQSTGVSWPIFLLIFAIHVLLTVISATFFWIHIKRLNRPKWLPPAYWVVGVGVVVLLVALLFPAGMLPQGDLANLPGAITYDPLFLFYLPTIGNPVIGWFLWGGLILLTVLFTSLPWLRLPRKKKPNEGQMDLQPPVLVNVIRDHCTGCTMCAVDCPYKAIKMVERKDGMGHKFLAVEDPTLCVSCGICIGSCDWVAVSMGQIPLEYFWQEIVTRIKFARMNNATGPVKLAFTCERHAAQGAKPFIEKTAVPAGGNSFEIITLPCVGAVPPGLIKRALDEGVQEVKVVGCPADDCTNREGNLWAEQRLVRERVPRIKREAANAPITAYWLPPDDFAQAMAPVNGPKIAAREGGQTVDYLEQRRILKLLNWRNYIVAFLLLTLVMVAQVLLTDLPFKPYPEIEAINRVVVSDLGQSIGRDSFLMEKLGPELQLLLELDGQPVLKETILKQDLSKNDPFPFFFEYDISPGDHHLRLSMQDNQEDISFLFFDEVVSIAEDEILTIP